jgi:hypothetical protein
MAAVDERNIVSRYIQVKQVRARDLEDSDIFYHQGTWRQIMDVHKDMSSVETRFGPRGTSAYPEIFALADRAFEQHWEGDYVIVRYVLQEKSTGAEVEDALLMLDALQLVSVQAGEQDE